MLQLFTNNAVSLLAAPLSAGGTSLQVMAGYGALFPEPGPNEYFLVTLENETGTAREIIRVTNRTGDVLSFSPADRAQEGTTALDWGASLGNDTLVDHRITAGTLARTTSSWIVGSNDTTPVANTATISTTVYSAQNRGFKFFVTIITENTGRSLTLEILANISGLLSTNAEHAEWNTVGRVGEALSIGASIVLNTTTKTLSLQVQNNEAEAMLVKCLRLEHGA